MASLPFCTLERGIKVSYIINDFEKRDSHRLILYTIELPKMKPLSFNENGDFKILQLADLHFTNEEGTCRDIPVDVNNVVGRCLVGNGLIRCFV